MEEKPPCFQLSVLLQCPQGCSLPGSLVLQVHQLVWGGNVMSRTPEDKHPGVPVVPQMLRRKFMTSFTSPSDLSDPENTAATKVRLARQRNIPRRTVSPGDQAVVTRERSRVSSSLATLLRPGVWHHRTDRGSSHMTATWKQTPAV